VLAYHTPPPKKGKRKCHHQSLVPCFVAFLRSGVQQAITKFLLVFGEFFGFLYIYIQQLAMNHGKSHRQHSFNNFLTNWFYSSVYAMSVWSTQFTYSPG